MPIRTGFGLDVHQLKEGLALIIGTVKIPYHKGCLAHSDGDVLIHAICDSLLGAAGLRDIGTYFPDTDLKYKGIASSELLIKVREMIEKAGYRIVNIDSTIVLQKPKISPFIEEMIIALAEILKITDEQVSVKATTSEYLGFEGREEGISAYAVCLIEK